MPIATACFWLVTFLPLRPECSLPSPYSCITLLILFCAFLPYFRPEDFLLVLLDERFLLLDERFFVAIFPPFRNYFFFGTFAPFLRAFDNPMAIACLRLLILCLPDFLWRISVRTSELAFLLYLRLDFFLAGISSPFILRRLLAFRGFRSTSARVGRTF